MLGMAKTMALKEADEKAEAEARALVETSDDLRPINYSDPDPDPDLEFTFLNGSTFINEQELMICCDHNSSFFILVKSKKTIVSSFE